MDRNEILAKLHNQFPSLPQNALLAIYKARSERMRLLMRNNIPTDIRWLIKAKVRLAEAAFVRGSQVLCIIPRALKPLGSLSDSSTEKELVVSTKKLFICAHTANEQLDMLQAYKLEPDSRTLVLECLNNDGNSSRSKKCKLDLTLCL
ncbi:hypothetical protein WN944_010650 [Citrus x changshan-huyou]|uniref:Uncharacterized protein n=1 Tax=Citrus x changshan-huyou TaxID=2935761 RepID=A0AAP0MYC8_9ROSI